MAVLDAGIAALGGLDALRGIARVSLRERGTRSDNTQDLSPYPPFARVPMEETTLIDRPARRVVTRLTREYSWGPWQQGVAIDGAQGFSISPLAKSARPLPEADHAAHHDRARRLPHFLLLAAREHAYTLRDAGEETIDGRPHRIITGNAGDGQLSHLAFDRETSLLTRVQFLYADVVRGDALDETLFRDYRKQNGLMVPGGRTVRRGGIVVEETEWTVEINPPLDAKQFAVPEGYAMRPPSPPRPRDEVRRLAKDVYLLEQIDGTSSNVFFVAFDDHVLVVEAPEAQPYRQLNERVLQTIGETVPGRPIRYVVPSHHHLDHGAGLRPYIARGVTVVTTPGNVKFVQELAALRFTVRPDALARTPRAPIVETIEQKRRVFRDASHVVELHDVGPERHVNELVAAWLPNERILFVADVFETGYAETARWDGKGGLGDVLTRFGWNVETLVTPHSRPRTLADLRPAS